MAANLPRPPAQVRMGMRLCVKQCSAVQCSVCIQLYTTNIQLYATTTLYYCVLYLMLCCSLTYSRTHAHIIYLPLQVDRERNFGAAGVFGIEAGISQNSQRRAGPQHPLYIHQGERGRKVLLIKANSVLSLMNNSL